MPGILKVLNFNVEGLFNKLTNSDFVEFLKQYDLICLTETHVSEDFELKDFKEFEAFSLPGKKLSKHGRRSGGILVLVRKTIAALCVQIRVEQPNVIVLELNKIIFGHDENTICIFCYLPPVDSPAYIESEYGVGIELLEHCVADLYSTRAAFSLFICGDFNARTGQSNSKDISNDAGLGQEPGEFLERSSIDLVVNNFGRSLLNFCEAVGCSILNGAIEFKFDNRETFISATGSSLIDYFILSNDLCSLRVLHSLKVLSSCVESNHLPVSLFLKTDLNVNVANPSRDAKPQWTEKLVWDKDKSGEFVAAFNVPDVLAKVADACSQIGSHPDEALAVLVNCLQQASQCMIKKVKCAGFRMSEKWFDCECFQKRKATRAALRKYMQHREGEDKQRYVECRRDYKQTCKRKQIKYKDEKVQSLQENLNNPTIFWKELRSCCGLLKKQSVQNSITKEEWVTHFRKVFCSDESNVDDWQNIDNFETVTNNEQLDGQITRDEVQKAIQKLSSGKACGVDEILSEMLKCGGEPVVNFLVVLFNHIFYSGQYPEVWTKGIIVPIHKKGDPDCADNYRGISLLSLLGKCYTSILNMRLYSWLEENDKISEAQAGFRRGYSTVDHVFTLYAATQKYLLKKGSKMYVAFIDLRKAFDTVKRETLISTLCRAGVSSKFVQAIRAMYKSVLACVRVNGELTEAFECPQGLRQGCMFSPTAFTVIINELANRVAEQGKHGVQFVPGLVELFILLFADDLALLSSTPTGLQTQLDIVQQMCIELGLTINTDKSKVMVFRHGGFLARNEKWSVDGHELEVVNKYVYLGFTFTTTMSLRESANQLATKGKNALFKVLRAYSNLENMSRQTFFKLFDTMIQPILLYASEVWSLLVTDDPTEKVHLFACKRYLNVATRTPNKMVYGELGRHPIGINGKVRALKFWFRLLKMDDSRLPKQAYRMLFSMDIDGKRNWVSELRLLLCRSGYAFVWEAQGVAREQEFVRQFKQRMVDMNEQDWKASLQESDRFLQYRQFKSSLSVETYLDCVKQKSFRNCLTKVRLGISDLRCHKNRYARPNHANAVDCPFCRGVEDTELHMVYVCNKFENFRPALFKGLSWWQHARHFETTLGSQNEPALRQLAWFLFKCFQERDKSDT